MYYDTTIEHAYQTEIRIIRSADYGTSATTAIAGYVRAWTTEAASSLDRIGRSARDLWADFDREMLRTEQRRKSWKARASVRSIPPGLLEMCALPPSTLRPRPALEPVPAWCGRRTRRADRKHVPTRGRHKPRVWERDA